VNHSAITQFVIPADEPNAKAHEWLTGLLNGLDWHRNTLWCQDRHREPILAKLYEQPRDFQIAILKACLKRMAWHRQQDSKESLSMHYQVGSVLYEMVGGLYRRKLPYAEDDICDILDLSRHRCGHGCDVTPPFDIAVDYARIHGLTPQLLSALKDFLIRLKGVGSAQVNHLKRRAGLLFILDAESEGKGKQCWSDQFRLGLLQVPLEEQTKWRQLILHMKTNDVFVMPKVWHRPAAKFLKDLGPRLVVDRVSAWWPDRRAKTVWPLQTGGSHLLKHFVWLLSLISSEDSHPLFDTPYSELQSKCIDLVCRLTELDWKPRERGQKVMIAAAYYLVEYPPVVSWPALQRLGIWSSSAPDGTHDGKIRELLREYTVRYKLSMPPLLEADSLPPVQRDS
jgi:hypothetical protein